MQTVKVTTSQNIDIDYEVAGLGERILGRLIDGIVFLLIFIFVMLLGIPMGTGSGSELFGLGIAVIVYLALLVFYDLFCEVFFNGQSIGKRVMKIRVISLAGSQPTLGQYLLRWIFRIVDFSLTGQLGALISVAVSDNNQRIGDIVAGTAVIKTHPRTDVGQIAFIPPAEDYEPVFPEAIHLTDRDIVLIHEVLSNFSKTDNHTLLYTAANKIKDHLGISNTQNLDNLQFLNTILKDYNYASARAGYEAR